jgi:hypothetical protein
MRIFGMGILLFMSGGAAATAPKSVDAGNGASGVCHHGEPTCADSAAPAKSLEKGAILVRGEKVGTAPAVTLAALLKSPKKHDGKRILVEGTVRKACLRKGCWMELADSEKGPGVRVTFKDYGFFVPLDSAGARARVEGAVEVKELSEATAQHYESEGGLVAREKDGKAREVHLVATGVELRR